MNDPSTRRRVLLAGAALASGGIAGCVGGSGAGGAGRLDRVEAVGSPGGTVRIVPEGTVVLLDFFATWCAPCRPQMAELRSVADRFPEVHLLSITNETDRDAIRSFWEAYGGSWSVAVDPDLETNERFDVTRVPTKILLDRDGAERWRHVGLSPAEDIAAAIEGAGGDP